MNVKHSVMTGTLGRYSDRFHEYQPAKTIEEKLEIARSIEGADGIEVVYPQEFGREAEKLDVVKSVGLPLSAVNVNVKGDAIFRAGSFTSTDPQVRAEAVRYVKTGMDLAVETGANMVSVCPLIDGWDHAFQADYPRQWAWLTECFQEVAAHRPEVKISIEYKPFETRNHIILPNMGRSLHFLNRLGAGNVGVTMDVGHALGAGEQPAAEACLAFDAGKLFYVHFNDNDRRWDWDTLPAAINLWETLETVYWVDQLGWNGWFAYDVFTRNGDPAEAITVTIRTIKRMESLLDKIGREQIAALIAEGIPARTYDALIGALL